MLTLILFSVILILIVTYIFIQFKQYDYFKSRNISGPTPSFFWGNLNTLWHVKSYSRQLAEWTKKYGRIYGLFEGTTPLFIVSDVEFLQEVFIKQFSNFSNRKMTVFTKLANGKRAHLFGAEGSQWRRQRHVINPTFSALKLKQMSSLINDCINELMKKLPNYSETREEFNIYALYKRMTMDVICRCGFGVDTDMQNNEDNIYLKKCGQVFASDVRKLPLMKLGTLIPSLGVIFGNLLLLQNIVARNLSKIFPSSILNFQETPGFWLRHRVQDIIQMRSDSAKQRVDLMNLMLEAASRENIEDKPDNDTNTIDRDQSVPKKLTYEEVISNVMLFMLAGYETTSTALAYATFVLANHSDVQQKLQNEIDQHFQDSGAEETIRNPDYDLVQNMPFMEIFVKEVLRMYPIASTVINRRCMHNTDVCGIKVTEGAVVQPDLYTIHYDPELWGPEDPNIFYPERHLTKRHPLAWMPFGNGPRNCVVKGDQLESKFNINEAAVIAPEEVWIHLEKRY
ncbi:unnamed protein product [Didymodactylos carnosus]|uniref:Cytochrome P450 n=1 Tax=Didymodactylos carnosus TaxID=1234261 RepID=A0A814BUH1_9BILA|nr:unnamed protein product [Didymodactylos carnosus]CAF3710603.1 unnamed protein product [Didymodactylos carnosus]